MGAKVTRQFLRSATLKTAVFSEKHQFLVKDSCFNMGWAIPCTRTLLGKAWIPALGGYPEAPGQGRAHASVLSYERGTVEVLCPESAHLPRTTKRPLA